MADADSERKPDATERGAKTSGTTHDSLRVLIALGAAAFALGVIASAIAGQYPYTVVFAVLVVLFIYFYRLSRKWTRPIGRDFNL